MSRRAARITRTEFDHAARIARDSGLAVRIEPNGAITIIPNIHRPPTIDGAENDDLDRELEAFEAKHGHD